MRSRRCHTFPVASARARARRVCTSSRVAHVSRNTESRSVPRTRSTSTTSRYCFCETWPPSRYQSSLRRIALEGARHTAADKILATNRIDRLRDEQRHIEHVLHHARLLSRVVGHRSKQPLGNLAAIESDRKPHAKLIFCCLGVALTDPGERELAHAQAQPHGCFQPTVRRHGAQQLVVAGRGSR